jgi:hypothetical protein
LSSAKSGTLANATAENPVLNVRSASPARTAGPPDFIVRMASLSAGGCIEDTPRLLLVDPSQKIREPKPSMEIF